MAKDFILILCAGWLFAGSAHGQTSRFRIETTIDVIEEGGAALVTVALSAPSTKPASIEYRTSGRTAVAGQDYVETTGVVRLEPGQRTAEVSIPILDDSAIEATETFVFEIFNAEGAPLSPFASERSWTAQIRDDERGYSFRQPHDPYENEPDVELIVLREGDFDFPSSVWVDLEAVEAVPGRYVAVDGVDFVDETFRLDFAAGQIEQRIRVRLLNDAVEDGDREFSARFRRLARSEEGYSPAGAAIPLGMGHTVAIIDNELGYSLERDSAGEATGDLYEGGEGYFVLKRAGDYNVATSVPVEILEISQAQADFHGLPRAIAGADFQPVAVTVQFAPGQTTARVPVTISNDTETEGPREYVHARFKTSETNPDLQWAQVGIADNDFNPLAVNPLCLGGMSLLEVKQILSLRNGKFLVLTREDLGAPQKVLRFTASGEPDPQFKTFTPEIGISSIRESPDGQIYIHEYATAVDRRFQRLNADGAVDESFVTTVPDYWEIEPAASGKVYVWYWGGDIRRLNADGSFDESFPAISTGWRITKILPADDLSFFVAGDGGLVRYGADGVLDTNYRAETLGFEILLVAGKIYIFGNEIKRLTETGAIDPTFTPVPYAQFTLFDAQGRIYRQIQMPAGILLERFAADGVLDPTYRLASLHSVYAGSLMLSGDGTALAHSRALEANGAQLDCGGGTGFRGRLLRVNFEPPAPHFQLEPGAGRLREGDPSVTGLNVIRTGPNVEAASVRYRIRSGSAVLGEEFNAAAEGELTFASGVSRKTIPLSVRDDNIPELQKSFFLEFLDGGGNVISSHEAVIVNDDPGMRFVRRVEGDEWEVLPIADDSGKIALRRSRDFQSYWEMTVNANRPMRMRFLAPQEFFRFMPTD